MLGKRMLKKLTPLLAGLGVALCLVLIPAPVAVAQAVQVAVDAPAGVEPGEYFTAKVSISGVTDFDAADFELTFDSRVVEIEDIAAGGDISDGLIDTTAIPVVGANEISAGVIKIVANVPGIPGVAGSGYLCQIRFHAIGAAGSSTSINLQNGTLSNKNAELIAATWGGTTVSVEAEAAAPPVTPPPVAPHPGGLSKGAMIGIVTAAVVVIALIVFFVVRRRRRYD